MFNSLLSLIVKKAISDVAKPVINRVGTGSGVAIASYSSLSVEHISTLQNAAVLII